MFNYLFGSIIYFLAGIFFALLYSIPAALVGLLVGAGIGLVAGLFNGTGLLWVETTAFDIGKLFVLVWFILAAHSLLEKYPKALVEIRDVNDVERRRRNSY